MDTMMSEQTALRVALTAKTLPQIELRALLGLLIQHLGAPLTETKLLGLSPKVFRVLVSSLGEGISRKEITQALTTLTSPELNAIDAPIVGDVSLIDGPKLTIAMTSNQGEMLNGHYGSCLRILIYELSEATYQLVDVRPIQSDLKGEARACYLLEQIQDCQILFTLSIGGPAAARVTRAQIHPVKKPVPVSAQAILDELQSVIRRTPPPWIQKALLKSFSDIPKSPQDADHILTQFGII